MHQPIQNGGMLLGQSNHHNSMWNIWFVVPGVFLCFGPHETYGNLWLEHCQLRDRLPDLCICWICHLIQAWSEGHDLSFGWYSGTIALHLRWRAFLMWQHGDTSFFTTDPRPSQTLFSVWCFAEIQAHRGILCALCYVSKCKPSLVLACTAICPFLDCFDATLCECGLLTQHR